MFKTILAHVARGGAIDHRPEAEGSRPRVPEEHRQLHLGCGSNLISGWLNVDRDVRPGVFSWDLRRPLPFVDQSVDLIFNEHFIEHIYRHEALALLQECRRVLKDDGTLRISTPNLAKLIQEYDAGRLTEWADVGWVPGSPCQLLNEGMHSWGHLFLYDTAEFETILSQAGFERITHVAWRQSTDRRLQNLECRPYHGEIIVEASPKAQG